MLLKMYSIRDSAAEIFNTPFFCRAEGEALRNIAELVKDERSTVHKRPEHFDLYYLGNYDDGSGKIETLPTPEHVQKAVAFVKQKMVESNA